jgi:hypothetical protein
VAPPWPQRFRYVWSSRVTTNLTDAYEAQRAALDRRVQSGGRPREVHSIADYLALDANYRQRFARRALRRPLIRNAFIPAGIAIMVVVLGSVWQIASS